MQNSGSRDHEAKFKVFLIRKVHMMVGFGLLLWLVWRRLELNRSLSFLSYLVGLISCSGFERKVSV